MNAAILFGQKFDGRYDLINNNCQNFAQELYDYLTLSFMKFIVKMSFIYIDLTEEVV